MDWQYEEIDNPQGFMCPRCRKRKAKYILATFIDGMPEVNTDEIVCEHCRWNDHPMTTFEKRGSWTYVYPPTCKHGAPPCEKCDKNSEIWPQKKTCIKQQGVV